MRIVGEQGSPGDAALRRQGPTVGTVTAHRRRDRLVISKGMFDAVSRRNPCTRLARGPSPELDGPVPSQTGQLERPLQLLPHRPAEVELDENPDGQRILHPPRLRIDPQKPDLGGNPLSEIGECGVHACRICLQLPPLARSQHCSLATSGRRNSQHPHLPVAVESRLSKNLGQTAGRQSSRHFHLKKPIAGVKISLGKPQGGLTAGIHVRDTPPIEQNLNPSRAAGQGLDKRTAFGKAARR